MPDTSAVTSQLNDVTHVIGAVAALGTAAFGLVDVTKVFGGGVSNAGFGYISRALAPFESALAGGGGPTWRETLRAHWINGMAKDDQKAVAKGLIRLGLPTSNAAAIAAAGRVAPAALGAAIANLFAGAPLTPVDIDVLGRLDAMVDATLDGAYERADQFYRNASKALAAVFAIALSIAAEIIILQSAATPAAPFVLGWGFLLQKEFWMAVIVGTVAVPLAPIAKDLSSSLASAVSAMRAV